MRANNENIEIENKNIIFNNIQKQKNIKKYQKNSSGHLINYIQNQNNAIPRIRINNNYDLNNSIFNHINNNNSNNPLCFNDSH